MKNFRYIYGPVSSWRLGSSLGIDLLSQKDKICTFNCTYCQIGETCFYTAKREIFVPTEKILEEIKALPDISIDYITFSGSGEPTLAKNLGETIRAVKSLRKEPIAVLTNSSLMPMEEVRGELLGADLVSCKIDASSEETFLLINRPGSSIIFENVIEGIKIFHKSYRKKLAIQIMFTNENKNEASKIAGLARQIRPDEIQICTPLRPSKVGALSESEVIKLKEYFKNFKVITIYDKLKKDIKSPRIGDALKRRGKLDV